MFTGLVLMVVFILLGEFIGNVLRDADWIYEDGWLHALAAALILMGAWKWLNAREDCR